MARPVEHMEGYYIPPVHVLNPQYSIKDSILHDMIGKALCVAVALIVLTVIAVLMVAFMVSAQWVLEWLLPW